MLLNPSFWAISEIFKSEFASRLSAVHTRILLRICDGVLPIFFLHSNRRCPGEIPFSRAICFNDSGFSGTEIKVLQSFFIFCGIFPGIVGMIKPRDRKELSSSDKKRIASLFITLFSGLSRHLINESQKFFRKTFSLSESFSGRL